MLCYAAIMQLCEVYQKLGEDGFAQLVRGISMGKLKTYQLFDPLKTRAHMAKLNTEHLRKAAPRLWARITEGDEEFAKDFAQAVLVSHLDLIAAALDLLGVPHENGFFAKDMDPKPYFTEGWEERVFSQLKAVYPEMILVFYINHLRWELLGAESIYQPVAV